MIKAQSNNGRCFIDTLRDSEGNTVIMRIEFTGDLARLPSTSNSKRIVYPKTKRVISRHGQKFFGKFSTPRIAHSAVYAEKSKRMLAEFHAQAVAKNLKSPVFPDKTLIHVFASLTRIANHFDSHNFCKPIGDFLQNAGVVSNDSWLQIFCVKQVDYPEVAPPESTVLFLLPERIMKPHILRAFKAMSDVV